MKRIIFAIALFVTMIGAAWAEIAYGESQTFAMGSSTSVQAGSVAPLSAASLSVSPNPAMAMAKIRWSLGNTPAAVRLSIYNVNGGLVRSFSANAGTHQVSWDGKNSKGVPVSSGIYIARIVSGKNVLNKNLVLCR